jgi:hypothetical protein
MIFIFLYLVIGLVLSTLLYHSSEGTPMWIRIMFELLMIVGWFPFMIYCVVTD